MWAAVCGDRECAVLQWLAVSAGAVSVPITGESVPGFEVASLGWEVLCRNEVGGSTLAKICRSGCIGKGFSSLDGVATSVAGFRNAF